MKLWPIKVFLGISLLATASPTLASWKTLHTAEDCRIANTWELGTTIIINKAKSEDIDNLTGSVLSDDVIIFITNPDWKSLKKDPEAPYADFKLRLDDGHGSWLEGVPLLADNSLLLTTKLEWLRNFELSNSIEVTRDGKKVGSYDWNFYSGMQALDRCIRLARAPILERQRQERLRNANPADPFEDKP